MALLGAESFYRLWCPAAHVPKAIRSHPLWCNCHLLCLARLFPFNTLHPPPPAPSCSWIKPGSCLLPLRDHSCPSLPHVAPGVHPYRITLPNHTLMRCYLRNRHMKPIYYMDLTLLIRTLSHFLQRPLEKFLSHLSAPNSYPPEKLILLSLHMYRDAIN